MAARICRYSTGPALSPRLTNLRLISTPPDVSTESSKNTHFKITLRRSAISLGDKKKGTLAALGLHRRNQTVFHPHKPDIAGKILAVMRVAGSAERPCVGGCGVANGWYGWGLTIPYRGDGDLKDVR
ncbi:hypothetical protein C8R45DRAFT_1099891 [Mycena sanguinolenta]|nr:hypothetical protein C8R45DRAFT_1099891 [Mycena sanguinolenta]